MTANEPKVELICPVCKSKQFHWGHIVGTRLRFVPLGTLVEDNVMTPMIMGEFGPMYFNSNKMPCAVCQKCKHMMMFLE